MKMNAGKLNITAELRIKDSVDLDRGLSAIEVFCVDMMSEPGCHLAIAHQDNQDPRRVVLWEIYQDQAAFEAHFNAEHTQRFIEEGLTDLVRAYETHPITKAEQGEA